MWPALLGTVGSALLGSVLSKDGGGNSNNGMLPQQVFIEPPEPFELDTTSWGGMGPTATPQTFTQDAKPPWMQEGNFGVGATPGQSQNWFASPWWGMSASDPTQALTQEDLMYQAPAAPAAPAEEAAPAPAQAAQNVQAGYLPWLNRQSTQEDDGMFRSSDLAKQNGRGYGSYLSSYAPGGAGPSSLQNLLPKGF